MLGLQIVFYILINSRSDELVDNDSPEISKVENFRYQSGYDLSIDTLYAGLSQSIRIEGKGHNNSLLGLWQNGKYSSSAIVGLH